MNDLTVTFPSGLTAASRAGLFIAHPGHELRVLGWLRAVRPRVCVLTDGSGHGDTGRVSYTARLVAAANATRGTVFGRYQDRHLYKLLLRRDHAALDALAVELVEEMERDRIDYLVSDAAEGYNSGHDVCRLMAAVVARQLGVPHFEFPLIGRPDECSSSQRPDAVSAHLGKTALAQKLAAAREYEPLRDEVQTALDQVGIDAFAVECLRPASSPGSLADVLPADPFYERHGEQQVESGHYARPIRRADHLLPLAHYLDRRSGEVRG